MKAESINSIEKIEACSINVPFVQSEAEKKLVKKINYTFMPFVCLLLFIQVSTYNHDMYQIKIPNVFPSMLINQLSQSSA